MPTAHAALSGRQRCLGLLLWLLLLSVTVCSVLVPPAQAVRVNDRLRAEVLSDPRKMPPNQLQPAAATSRSERWAATTSPPHSLAEASSGKLLSGILNMAANVAGGLKLGGVQLPSTGSAIPPDQGPAPAELMLRAEDIENCVACRYIWLQVELDVFNSQSEEQIYHAFTSRCQQAMLTSIFYDSCKHMQFYVRKMISEYMQGYTVNQICANSLLCL